MENTMPVIRVEMFSGRNKKQKASLVKDITNVFIKTCGGKAEEVDVIITDIDKDHWGQGGKLFSDQDN